MEEPVKSLLKTVVRHPAGRYALAPVFLAMAVLLSIPADPVSHEMVEYLFLAAVAASAWLGGRGPGLVAAALAPFTLDYCFVPPLYTLGIQPKDWPSAVPFLVAALGTMWVSSLQTGKRRSEDLLRQGEAKFRRILTNLPDTAWTVDETGRVAYVSPKVVDVLGYSNEEIYSGGTMLLLERVHPADLRRMRSAMEDLFQPGGGFDLEYRFRRKDNAWIWLHSRAVSYSTEGVCYADGVMTNISEHKQSEAELRAKTAFLEAQTNATIDGILVVNADGRLLLQNRRFKEIFSIPEELLHAPDDGPVLDHVVGLMKEPEAFRARVLHLYTHPDETGREEIELADGTIIDRYTAPVRGTGGQYYGRIWVFRDITEAKRSEDRLRQLSAAVEQSPVSIVITNPKGSISYVNRKFSESTGYGLDEVLGKNPRILNSGHSPREMYRALWSTIREGREWRGEFRNRRKNGEFFWEAATISPITDANGSISHFLAVKEDITERRALESELRQAQKLEAIGQLAAGIAHEINTPIQFITDNLTFLEDAWAGAVRQLESRREAGEAPEPGTHRPQPGEEGDFDFMRQEAPKAIAQSLEGARRVAAIVRAMKEFSHPDLSEQIEFDLNRGIESTITIARSEWKYAAEMVTDLDATLPPVKCYPGDINQVVLNLIVNAAHAIEDKAGRTGMGLITVRTRRNGEFAEIAVTDTGVGIPGEIQGRIFEPFFTTREVGSGTGQGLAMAHSVIVRKHRGKIWFETEVGKGTTFFVHLAIASPQKPEEP